MKPFQRIVLPNGLRIILVPEKESVATTVLVLVEAGSKYETKAISGLSHFLEHMCFKGTVRRPKAIDISGELDGLGAEYNAFTSQEHTGYYAKVQAAHTDTALDIVSDIYLHPVFDPHEIEKEKGVIIEEINMYEDLPPRKIQDVFMELLYGDQPAGWNIAGKKEIVQQLTSEDFLKYRGEHYVAKATTLVMAGAFDAKKTLPKIRRAFETVTVGKKAGKVATRESQKEPAVKVIYKESDQTHVVLGVRAFDTYDRRRYTLDLLTDILGGGMSSRLFQKIRDELGAAYYVRADADLSSDHGFMEIAAGIDHKKISIVIKAILEECRKLVQTLVPAKELSRAKDHLSGRLLLGLETSDALATFYGGQEVLGEPLETPEEILKKVRAVTADAIRGVARDILRNERLNLAIIGPYRDEAEFKSILHF